MVSIGSLRYDIIADTEQFQKGIIATRRELTAAKRLFKDTRSPIEELGIELEGMGRLLAKGANDPETFARAVAKIGDEVEGGREAQQRFIEGLRQQAKEIQDNTGYVRALTAEESALINRLNAGADAAEKQIAVTNRQSIETERLAAELREAKNEEQRQKQAIQRGIQVTRQAETATERYAREVAELNDLARRGAIDQKTLQRSIANLRNESTKAKKDIRGLSSGLTDVKNNVALMVKGFVAFQATRAVIGGVADELARVDEVAKTSRKLGFVANELIGIRLAGEELAGMMSGSVDMALQRMTRRLSEAANGTGEAKAAIEELRLDAGKLNSAGPAQAFREIADAIRMVEDPADRLRLAFKLFDSEGASLVNVLNEGSGAVDDFIAKADELGLSFDSVDASNIEAANDAITEMKASAGDATRELTAILSPALKEAADAVTNAIRWYKFARDELAKMAAKVTGAEIVGGEFGDGRFDEIAAAQRKRTEAAMQAKKEAEEFKAIQESNIAQIKRMEQDRADSHIAAIQKETQALKEKAKALVGNDPGNVPEPEPPPKPAFGASPADIAESERKIAQAQKEMAEAKKELELAQKEADRVAVQEDLEAQGQRIAESLQTPFDRLVSDLADLEVLVNVGALDSETADKERQRIESEAQDKQDLKAIVASVAQRGSREEYRLIAQAVNGKQDRAEQQRREQIKIATAQKEAMERAANKLEELEPAESIG